MTEDSPSDRGDDDRQDRDPVDFGTATPPAEWAIAITGALIAATVIALLIVQSLQTSEQPALLMTDVAPPTETDADSRLVRITVRNVGGRPASNVHVRGRLIVEGEPVEEAVATIDYVPAGTERHVLLQYVRDPAGGRLDVSSLGFTDP